MGLGFSGADIMALPPDMLRTIMQLLQSGQWGTPQGFEQLFAGPNMTGQGAQIGGRKNWLREHQGEGSDPFGWGDFLEGKDFAPGQSRPYTIDELNARRQYQGGTFAKNPYSTAPQDAVGSGPPIEQGPFVNNLGGNPFITPEDMEILRKIPSNLRGQELLDALPPGFNEEYYRSYANSGFPLETFLGFGGNPRMTTPLNDQQSKLAAANALGFGAKGLLQTNKGEFGVNDRVNRGNAMQALKSAGWDESMGYGPQKTLSDKMNQLLYAVSPKYDKSKIPVPEKDPQLAQVYDPFGGMQSAINRDAYVNETLGGGFYGGVIPEEKDQFWGVQDMLRRGGGRGGMTDPHFATPQTNAMGERDLYAGWASNQAQQFGSLPYEMFGQQVNDINSPMRQAQGAFAGNMVRNTAPPTWNGGNPTPWPMSGGGNKNVWGAPWGGNQSSTPSLSPANNPQAAAYQNNSPSFNPDPWSNPWNMK